MTKKELQEKENLIVKTIFDDTINGKINAKILRASQLRSCSATVLETKDAYILRSYRTIVAILIKETGILYDGLRYVYGYTATSAQHISKFGRDYGAQHKYTYYPI